MPQQQKRRGSNGPASSTTTGASHGASSSAHGTTAHARVGVLKPVILPSMRMETGTSVDEALAASRAFAGRATWGAGGESGGGRSGGRNESERVSGGGSPHEEDGGVGGRGASALGGATWGASRGEDARRGDDVGESRRAAAAAAAAKPKPVIKVLRRKTVEETGASAERSADTVSSRPSKASAPQLQTTTTTSERVREDKPVDRERIVDTPGSDLLQTRGGTAPVVLRRKPEPTPSTNQEENIQPASAEDPDKKARKQRGGRRVREREMRRVERVQMRAHNEAGETGSGLQNVPQPVDSNWVNAYPGYPYMAPNTYGMAFSDANALFHTFAPNYQGHTGHVPNMYYGYAAAPNPYAQQAPVTVPTDAPDIKATGTYGGKTSAKKKNAVKRLTKKLADLPSSLGAEFGSTDDLSSFADPARDDKSATTTTTTTPQNKRAQRRRPGGRHAKSTTKSTSQQNKT